MRKSLDTKSDLFLKLRYVYLPLFLSSTLTVLLFGIARWYLNLQYDIIHISTDIQFWVFMGIGVIVWATYVRKPITTIKLARKPSSDLQIVHFIAAAAIIAPLITSQFYLIEKNAKLYQIESLCDIEEFHENDYFQIAKLEFDKTNYGVFYSIHSIGRNNEDVTLNANYAIPITCNLDTQLWIGVQFREQYGTREYKQNRKVLWNKFIESTQKQYRDYNPLKHKYLRIKPQSDQRREYIEAVQNSDAWSGTDKIIIFTTDDHDYDQRFGGEEKWFFISFISLHLLFLIIIYFLSIDRNRLAKYLSNKPTPEDDDLKEALEFFIPRKGHFITSIIIIINLLVFIWMLASDVSIMHPLTNDLMRFGALRYKEVMEGEYWRLLTSGFVHIGIGHLLMNMIFLALLGFLVESTTGRWRFLFIYIVTLIGANINALYWSTGAASAGASGAMFGLMGWMLAQVLLKRETEDGVNMAYLIIVLGFGGITLLVGLFNNANNAAHLGGLAVGFVLGLGLALYDWIKK